MENKRNIKKFILFVIKLGCILVTVYYAYQGLFWYLWLYEKGPVAYDTAYQQALARQYNQISNPERENEIIFFGSSTCTFGIDVNEVKNITGENAQIFGIESAVSPSYLMKELKSIAKPGDTICCVFDGGDKSSEDFITICCAFEQNKEYLKNYFDDEYDFRIQKSSLVWRKLYAMSAGGLVEKVRSSISVKEQVYSIKSFDENGNMTKPRPECFVSTNISPQITLSFDDTTERFINELNEFDKWCKDNNIRFVIAHNMHPDGTLKNDDESLANYQKQLADALDAQIITKPQDGLIPVEQFYNSHFHLNDAGAKEYSSRIAKNLINEDYNEYFEE